MLAPGSKAPDFSLPADTGKTFALTDLKGYRIYWGTTQNSYPNSMTLNNAGLSSAVVDQLTPATWFFVVTAFDTSGNESAYSNVASKTVM